MSFAALPADDARILMKMRQFFVVMSSGQTDRLTEGPAVSRNKSAPETISRLTSVVKTGRFSCPYFPVSASHSIPAVTPSVAQAQPVFQFMCLLLVCASLFPIRSTDSLVRRPRHHMPCHQTVNQSSGRTDASFRLPFPSVACPVSLFTCHVSDRHERKSCSFVPEIRDIDV